MFYDLVTSQSHRDLWCWRWSQKSLFFLTRQPVKKMPEIKLDTALTWVPSNKPTLIGVNQVKRCVRKKNIDIQRFLYKLAPCCENLRFATVIFPLFIFSDTLLFIYEKQDKKENWHLNSPEFKFISNFWLWFRGLLKCCINHVIITAPFKHILWFSDAQNWSENWWKMEI